MNFLKKLNSSSKVLFIALSKTGSRVLRRLLPSNTLELHVFPAMRHGHATKVWTPTPLPLQLLYDPARHVVSMVRSPYNRLMSEYSFMHAPCHISDFVDFANDSYRFNWQLGVLSGKRELSQSPIAYSSVTKQDLDTIYSMVQRQILLLGVFESYFKSVSYIMGHLGLSMPSPERVHRLYVDNRRYHRPVCRGRLHQFQLNEFKKNNQLDLQLWKFANRNIHNSSSLMRRSSSKEGNGRTS